VRSRQRSDDSASSYKKRASGTSTSDAARSTSTPLAPTVAHPDDAVHLQQRIGNAALANLIGSRVPVQAKLQVGRPDDPQELEADRVADAITADGAGIERPVRPQGENRAGGGTSAPPSIDQALASPSAPLPGRVRTEMEGAFNRDLSDVRVHVGHEAEPATSEIAAQAFTVGRDIVFAPGRYAPATREGRHLLAHELTHVAQQTSGRTMKTARRQPEHRSGPTTDMYKPQELPRTDEKTVPRAREALPLITQDLQMLADEAVALSILANPILYEFEKNYPLAYDSLKGTLAAFVPDWGPPPEILSLVIDLTLLAVPGGAIVKVGGALANFAFDVFYSNQHQESQAALTAKTMTGWLHGTMQPLQATTVALKVIPQIHLAALQLMSEALRPYNVMEAAVRRSSKDSIPGVMEAAKFLNVVPIVRTNIAVAVAAMRRLQNSYKIFQANSGYNEERKRLLAVVGPQILSSPLLVDASDIMKKVLIPAFPELGGLAQARQYGERMSLAELVSEPNTPSTLGKKVHQVNVLSPTDPTGRLKVRFVVPGVGEFVADHKNWKESIERLHGFMETRQAMSLPPVEEAVRRGDAYAHERVIEFYSWLVPYDWELVETARTRILPAKANDARKMWGRLAGVVP